MGKLDRLFEVLLDDLIKKIEDGKATPADLSVARNLLKDNNIGPIAEDVPKITTLLSKLPFNED